MTWCRQATSHYLSQCWPRSMSPYGVTRGWHYIVSEISVTIGWANGLGPIWHQSGTWSHADYCSWFFIFFLNFHWLLTLFQSLTLKSALRLHMDCTCTVLTKFGPHMSLEGVNKLRLRQNDQHLPDNIFKCIFLNNNVWISNTIWLNFVPKGPIGKNTALVQIMAWHRPGNKPLSEPMMPYIGDAYMHHSMG